MKKTNVPPFDETPATPISLHPKLVSLPYHETLQPLGVHFKAFLEDFIFDEIPDERIGSLDSNARKIRKIILEGEKLGFTFSLLEIEFVLRFQIPERGSEWKASL